MTDQQLGQRAIEALRRHLDHREVAFEPAGNDRGFDLMGEFEGHRLIIHLKAMRRGTIEDMKGRLATAVLQFQRTPAAEHGQPTVFLHAPRIGRRAIADLESFMSDYAPDVAWGAFDDRDSFHFEAPGLDIEVDERGRRTGDEARKTTHNRRAFTDLNRWLLKILMLRDVPKQMWKQDEEYRREFGNPNDLKDIADVSQAKAYQFARTFRDLGFLKWDRQEFRIHDRRHLFELWYEEERQLHIEKHPARSIFGPRDLDEIFVPHSETVEYALGGFAACKLHGVLHTDLAVPRVHISGRPEYVMDELDLEPTAEHQAELCLIELPYAESIFRGTVKVEGMRTVDILQAALDSGRHRGRGREQAEFIVEHVLGWNLWK